MENCTGPVPTLCHLHTLSLAKARDSTNTLLQEETNASELVLGVVTMR